MNPCPSGPDRDRFIYTSPLCGGPVGSAPVDSSGLGQGVAANGALQGVARNPSASNTIQTQLIISLALIESIAIYGFLIGILLWLKVPGL